MPLSPLGDVDVIPRNISDVLELFHSLLVVVIGLKTHDSSMYSVRTVISLQMVNG